MPIADHTESRKNKVSIKVSLKQSVMLKKSIDHGLLPYFRISCICALKLFCLSVAGLKVNDVLFVVLIHSDNKSKQPYVVSQKEANINYWFSIRNLLMIYGMRDPSYP
jgi:hypothetical protein